MSADLRDRFWLSFQIVIAAIVVGPLLGGVLLFTFLLLASILPVGISSEYQIFEHASDLRAFAKLLIVGPLFFGMAAYYFAAIPAAVSGVLIAIHVFIKRRLSLFIVWFHVLLVGVFFTILCPLHDEWSGSQGDMILVGIVFLCGLSSSYLLFRLFSTYLKIDIWGNQHSSDSRYE